MEIDVDNEILKIWDEIGFSQEERSLESLPLNQQIEQVKRDFIEETVKKCQTLGIEIEEIKRQHIHMLQISGAPLTEIECVEKSGIHGSLKERFDQVNEAFDEYTPQFNRRVEMFHKHISILSKLFDDLEISQSDRGEFTAIGDIDLTDDRLHRFESKVDSLRVQINANNQYAEELYSKISNLSELLGVEVSNIIEAIMDDDPIKPSQLLRLKEEVDELEQEVEANKNRIAELAVTIKSLWDIMKIDEKERNEFLETYSGVSFDEVRACVEKINELNERRNKMMPQLIKEVKQSIKDICSAMRYTTQQVDDIFHKAIIRINKLCQESGIMVEENAAPKNDSKETLPKENAKEENVEEVQQSEEQHNKEAEEDNKEQVSEEVKEQQRAEEEINEESKEEEQNVELPNEEMQNSEEEEEKNEPKIVFMDSDDLEIDADIEKSPHKWEIKTERLEPKPNTGKENVAIIFFEVLEAEMQHLKKLQKQSLPIFELIEKRESILNEQKEIEEKPAQELTATKKVVRTRKSDSYRAQNNQKEVIRGKGKKTSMDPKSKDMIGKNEHAPKAKSLLPHQLSVEKVRYVAPSPSDLLHAEKVRRRVKTVLPRIEKKLAIALLEFKKENGEDFTIDGNKYIDELAHVQLTETDKIIARASLSNANQSSLSGSAKRRKSSLKKPIHM